MSENFMSIHNLKESFMSSHPVTGPADLIGDLLSLGARRSPTRMLFALEGGMSRTYGEVDVRANRIANGILGQGLQKGDRVAVWADDSIEYLETYMAAARAGLVVVPVNNRLTADEAKFIVEDCGARCLIISDVIAPKAAETFGSSDLPLFLSFGNDLVLGAKRFEDLVSESSSSAPPPPEEDDLYIIAYTSGTTGFPKGAMLTHRSVKNIARMNAVSYHLPLASVAAYTGSMSFTSTVCAFAMSHLYVGGSMSLLGKWDPERAVDLILNRRANFVYTPSPGIDDFANALKARPQALDTLTTVLHSASKASPDVLERLVDVVGGRFVEGWGMTEMSGGIVTATCPQDFTQYCEAQSIFKSAGRSTADAVVEIVDQNREPLAHDGVCEGELAIRAACVMAGYWARPGDTSKVLVDGWYYSGDIGSIDPAGYVYVHERRVDLIVSGGMNIYPAEVETIIIKMPEVQEVAVVGAPHDKYGQTVAAVIVLIPGARLSEEQVVEFCRSQMASYKKPTIVRFIDELPRTVSLKVKRQAVRKDLFGDGK
jgi:fatty-acyl-CoA synthase